MEITYFSKQHHDNAGKPHSRQLTVLLYSFNYISSLSFLCVCVRHSKGKEKESPSAMRDWGRGKGDPPSRFVLSPRASHLNSSFPSPVNACHTHSTRHSHVYFSPRTFLKSSFSSGSPSVKYCIVNIVHRKRKSNVCAILSNQRADNSGRAKQISELEQRAECLLIMWRVLKSM